MKLIKPLNALVTAALFLASALIATASERIALVVGNGQYAAVTPLDNPAPDAKLIAQRLEDAGFDVTLVIDADQITLNRAIAQFGRVLRQAGKDATGLFYYAGHGVQSFGTNYLVPTDAVLTDAADLSLVGVQAEAVLRQMASARNAANIVILDACRDNPFQDIPDLDDNGLAEMKAPTGTFLSYSTAPGAVALDGTGENSPFTQALAKHMPSQGLPIEQLFKQVRVDVLAETQGQQTPWDTSSLTQQFAFVEGVVISPEEVAENQLWESVRETDDPVQIMLFLRGYPTSKHAPQARIVLNELLQAELAPQEEEAPKAPVVAQPEADEKALIDLAQKSGKAVDYEAYLKAFPAGTYAELAQFELNILAQRAARATTTETPAAPPTPTGPETFTTPLAGVADEIEGLNFAQIIEQAPSFPPIEGLPDEVWKDQQCSNCHVWTQAALCDQGKTYLKANNARSLSKQHPFGGGFKQSLKHWAGLGCQ